MTPNLDEIKKLHRKYALNNVNYNIVYSHCEIIWEIAKQIIREKSLKVDTGVVQVGAFLHDIGVYKLINNKGEWDEENYIKHGIIGYDLLKSEDIADSICEIARRHTGVGIFKEDIQKEDLPLPLMDYTAQNIEERLIMYSDKFHSKTPKFNSFESYSKSVQKFGKHKLILFEKLAEEFGKPNLEALSKKYQQPIV